MHCSAWNKVENPTQCDTAFSGSDRRGRRLLYLVVAFRGHDPSVILLKFSAGIRPSQKKEFCSTIVSKGAHGSFPNTIRLPFCNLAVSLTTLALNFLENIE